MDTWITATKHLYKGLIFFEERADLASDVF